MMVNSQQSAGLEGVASASARPLVQSSDRVDQVGADAPRHSAPEGSSYRCPVAARRHVYEFKPLLHLTLAEVLKLQRDAGMHPPAEEYREGAAAFALRPDVTVGDAMDSMSMHMLRLHSLLVLMSVQDGCDEVTSNSADACRHLVNELQGFFAVVQKGVAAAGITAGEAL